MTAATPVATRSSPETRSRSRGSMTAISPGRRRLTRCLVRLPSRAGPDSSCRPPGAAARRRFVGVTATDRRIRAGRRPRAGSPIEYRRDEEQPRCTARGPGGAAARRVGGGGDRVLVAAAAGGQARVGGGGGGTDRAGRLRDRAGP